MFRENFYGNFKKRERNGGTRDFLTDWSRSERSVRTLSSNSELQGHEGCVNTISFDKSGTYLVSGSDDETVKIWNVRQEKCLASLRGHTSNVFSALFFTTDNNEILSGGNDGDVRHYNIEKNLCTVYRHHTQKVLQISMNPRISPTFLSCSADGTIRFFDVRLKYGDSFHQHINDEVENNQDRGPVRPQFFGGGRQRNADDNGIVEQSLLLDYNQISRDVVLYSVNWNPSDENKFIVSSSIGDIRLFDMRKIDKNPNLSYINIYCSTPDRKPKYEISGSAFSHDGSELIGTCLSNHIYLFNTNDNFEEYYNYKTGREQPIRKETKSSDTTTTPSSSQSTNTSNEESISLTEILTSSTSETTTTSTTPTVLKKCAICGSEENLSRCARCKSCWYCSREHQREDWNQHKLICGKEPKESKESKESTTSTSEKPKPQCYKYCYSGHISRRTIKGCSFYGPNSEFIITGSDDANIYIYEKATGKLLNVLEGHDEVVNCIANHPHTSMFASSGIDHVVKIWENNGEYPNELDLLKKEKRFKEYQEVNREAYTRRDESADCTVQ